MHSRCAFFLRLLISLAGVSIVSPFGGGSATLAADSSEKQSPNVRRAGVRRSPCSGGLFGVYDDFDGHGAQQDGGQLAVAGRLSSYLWDRSAEVAPASELTSNAAAHGSVLVPRLGPGDGGWKAVTLTAPYALPLDQLCAMSMDVLIPPEAALDSSINLRIAALIPDLDFAVWDAGINVSRGADGSIWIGSYYSNLEDGEAVSGGMPGEIDRWYNIRIEVQKATVGTALLSFFVDGALLMSGIPADSALLLDPQRATRGFQREVGIYRGDVSVDALGLVDNVSAVYHERVPDGAALYDDFDGHGGMQSDGTELAEAGVLGKILWNGEGSVVNAATWTSNPDGRGNVLLLASENSDEPWVQATLTNPSSTTLDDLRSTSVSVLIPAESAHSEFGAGLDISVSESGLAEEWWGSGMSLVGYPGGEVRIQAWWRNASDTGYSGVERGAEVETWYDLRMDISVVDGNRLRIDFIVNDMIFASGFPVGGELLSGMEGYRRYLKLTNENEAQSVSALFDSIHGAYGQRAINDDPLFDNFDGEGGQQADGTHLALSGELSEELWGDAEGVEVVRASDFLPDDENHGNVLKLDSREISEIGLPMKGRVRWLHYGGFSADVLLSSESDAADCWFNLEEQTPVPETLPGRYGSFHLGMKFEGTDYIYTYFNNENSSCQNFAVLENIKVDTWYNLRLDFVVVEDSRIRLDAYVNGFLRSSTMFCDGGLFLHPNPLLDVALSGGYASLRSLKTGCRTGQAVVLIDNIRAPYPGRPQPEKFVIPQHPLPQSSDPQRVSQ